MDTDKPKRGRKPGSKDKIKRAWKPASDQSERLLEAQKLERLPVGVVSRAVRVAAPPKVLDWFEAFPARERGELLAELMNQKKLNY